MTENIELIESLEQSKKLSTEIKEKVEIAKATEGRGAVKTVAWAARSRHVCARAVARGGFYAV